MLTELEVAHKKGGIFQKLTANLFEYDEYLKWVVVWFYLVGFIYLHPFLHPQLSFCFFRTKENTSS